MKKLLIFITIVMSAVLMLYCTPTVKALTNAETQALIQQLLTQIANIQAQIQQLQAQQQTAQPWCHDFSTSLGFSNSGTQEVSELHTALQKEGISYGQDTSTTYAEDTAEAIVKFQAKYSIKQTGYVGPLTRAKLNELYGCEDNNNPNPTCTPNWTCDQWDTLCVADTQSRRCFDSNNCGTTDNMPSLVRTCSTACTPNWTCTQYSSCVSNNQTRTCTDTNNCGVLTDKPATTQMCTFAATTCIPNWQTGAWSVCTGGQQTRTVTDSNNCGVLTDKPITTQACASTASDCTPNWTCTQYTPCVNNSHTRTCQDNNNCGVLTDKPPETFSCDSTTTTGCNDSNAADSDVYTKGTVTYNRKNYTDSCNSPTSKISYACSSDGSLLTYQVSCPLGCNDGACNSTGACVPNWYIGAWSACNDGKQARTVADSNYCGTTTDKPVTTQACAPATSYCTPNWHVGAWSACDIGIQTRTVTDLNNCGELLNITGRPPLVQTCDRPSCSPSWQLGTWSACINGTQTRTVTDANNCGTPTPTTVKPFTAQSCNKDQPDIFSFRSTNCLNGICEVCGNGICRNEMEDFHNCPGDCYPFAVSSNNPTSPGPEVTLERGGQAKNMYVLACTGEGEHYYSMPMSSVVFDLPLISVNGITYPTNGSASIPHPGCCKGLIAYGNYNGGICLHEWCGDGICDTMAGSNRENFQWCPQDCVVNCTFDDQCPSNAKCTNGKCVHLRLFY